MSFKWLESLLSKDSSNVSLDNQVKRHSDPMGLAGPLPYMSGGKSNQMISELKKLKPAFMKGGDWSSYLRKVVNNESKKVNNFDINNFIPNLIKKVKDIQNGG